MLNFIISKRSQDNRWRICSCCDFKELCNFGIQHKNVWSTLSPSPHLEHGLTEPNEKQHYLIVSKADYLWLQNPHFRQCNTLLRCICATTLFHAIKNSEKGGVLICFPMQAHWRNPPLLFWRMICSNTDFVSIYLHPCIHYLLVCLCECVCQRIHTAIGCHLVIQTLTGDEWVKHIVTRVWMYVCTWAWVCVPLWCPMAPWTHLFPVFLSGPCGIYFLSPLP